jgi:hypothetical protein
MISLQIKHNNDMKSAILALYFLPCLLRHKRANRHHISIIKDLNLIIGIDSFYTVETDGFYNGVSKILKIRKDWIIRNGQVPNKKYNVNPHVSRAKRTERALFHTSSHSPKLSPSVRIRKRDLYLFLPIITLILCCNPPGNANLSGNYVNQITNLFGYRNMPKGGLNQSQD